MRGRKPKSTADHKLAGDPGKRGRDKPAKSGPEKAPAESAEVFFSEEPPAWLGDGAKAVWVTEVRAVLERVILLPQGRQLFAIYCDALADFQRLTKFLRDNAETYETKTGFVRTRPEVDLRRDAFAKVQKLGEALNLSPKSWIQSMAQYQNRQLDLFAKKPAAASTQQPAPGAPKDEMDEYLASRPTTH